MDNWNSTPAPEPQLGGSNEWGIPGATPLETQPTENTGFNAPAGATPEAVGEAATPSVETSYTTAVPEIGAAATSTAETANGIEASQERPFIPENNYAPVERSADSPEATRERVLTLIRELRESLHNGQTSLDEATRQLAAIDDLLDEAKVNTASPVTMNAGQIHEAGASAGQTINFAPNGTTIDQQEKKDYATMFGPGGAAAA